MVLFNCDLVDLKPLSCMVSGVSKIPIYHLQ